jgi:uncharacterized protein involved in tolerance to divalent cations
MPLKRELSMMPRIHSFFRMVPVIAIAIVMLVTSAPMAYAVDESFAFYVYDAKTRKQYRLLKDADWFPQNSDYQILASPGTVVKNVIFEADCLPKPVTVVEPPFSLALPPVMKMCTIKVFGKSEDGVVVSQNRLVLSTHKDSKALNDADMDWRKNDVVYGYALRKDKLGNIQTAISAVPEDIIGKVAAKQLERRNRSVSSMASDYDTECKYPGNCESSGPPAIKMAQGSNISRIENYVTTPHFDFKTGNFSTTCEVSHYAYVDPLRKSTSTGSNLNMFWGNTSPKIGMNQSSDDDDSDRRSTCRGGIEDMSVYWAPAMINARGRIVKPSEVRVNYIVDIEHENPKKVYSFPKDYAMTTGFPTALFPMGLGMSNFSCEDKLAAGIPKCTHGDLEMQVNFLYCWNGIKDEDTEQRLQLERAEANEESSIPKCPKSHPYVLPAITYTIVYTIPPEGTYGWRLSSDRYSNEKTNGGYSGYGGFIDGWNPDTKKKWMDNCVRNSRVCLKGNLGNRQQLIY